MVLLICSPEKNNPMTTADRMTIISQLMSRPQLLVVTQHSLLFVTHVQCSLPPYLTTPEPELVALFLSE